MSNVKFNFFLFVTLYCCVEQLMACGCRPCNHYKNNYERCRCCTFHMVGGKRSVTLRAFNDNPSTAQLPKSLPRNTIQVMGKTQPLINDAIRESDESSISAIDHERMKSLMLSLLTDSNPSVLPQTYNSSKASSFQDFVVVPPSALKIGKRLLISPPFSIFGSNMVDQLDRNSAIKQDVLRSLVKPGMSQTELPRSENVNILPTNRSFYRRIFKALRDRIKRDDSAGILSSPGVEETAKRTLKVLLSRTNP